MTASSWILLFDTLRDDGERAHGRERTDARGTSSSRSHSVRQPSSDKTAPFAAPLDPHLASRIRAGDTIAFRELFHACWTPLVEYALRHVHARDAAIDVVQDVFVSL